MYKTKNNKAIKNQAISNQTAMYNYKITVSYDGMRYSGWQRLSADNSVNNSANNSDCIKKKTAPSIAISDKSIANKSIQGILEAAISQYLGTNTTITGSGRTDAGVSAIAQTANFYTSLKLDVKDFPKDINSLLPEDIIIKAIEPVPLDFHSRKSAVSKTYGYYIALDSKPDVFAAKHIYNPVLPPIMYNCDGSTPVNICNCGSPTPANIYNCGSPIPANICNCGRPISANIHNCGSPIPANICNCGNSIPVNMESMRTAADFLTGTHDFSAFTTDKTTGKSHVRTINHIDFSFINTPSGKPVLALTINGDGFLYNMVRIMAGTLLCTGLGTIPPKDIPAILHSGVRKNAGPTLPPNGLFLLEVLY